MEFHHSLSNWKARDFLNYPRKRVTSLRLKKDRFEVLVWIHWDAYCIKMQDLIRYFGLILEHFQIRLTHPICANCHDLTKMPTKPCFSPSVPSTQRHLQASLSLFLSKVTLLLRFPARLHIFFLQKNQGSVKNVALFRVYRRYLHLSMNHDYGRFRVIWANRRARVPSNPTQKQNISIIFMSRFHFFIHQTTSTDLTRDPSNALVHVMVIVDKIR